MDIQLHLVRNASLIQDKCGDILPVIGSVHFKNNFVPNILMSAMTMNNFVVHTSL
jgi:hypothetical protein